MFNKFINFFIIGLLIIMTECCPPQPEVCSNEGEEVSMD